MQKGRGLYDRDGYRPRDKNQLRDEILSNQNAFGETERQAMVVMARFATAGPESVGNAASKAAGKFETVSTQMEVIIKRLDGMGGGGGGGKKEVTARTRRAVAAPPGNTPWTHK